MEVQKKTELDEAFNHARAEMVRTVAGQHLYVALVGHKEAAADAAAHGLTIKAQAPTSATAHFVNWAAEQGLAPDTKCKTLNVDLGTTNGVTAQMIRVKQKAENKRMVANKKESVRELQTKNK